MMDDRVRQLLRDLMLGRITQEQFQARLPADVQLTKEYVSKEISAAMAQPNPDELDEAINLLWVLPESELPLDLLHQLLLAPHHYQHQFITKTIQDIGSPSSIPFIRAVLETDFDYLDYTASEPVVIAKWFSWALCSIGTPEAIAVIREFTTRGRKGIRKGMRYRLRKMGLEP